MSPDVRWRSSLHNALWVLKKSGKPFQSHMLENYHLKLEIKELLQLNSGSIGIYDYFYIFEKTGLKVALMYLKAICQ